jgi:hypothetical protein
MLLIRECRGIFLLIKARQKQKDKDHIYFSFMGNLKEWPERRKWSIKEWYYARDEEIVKDIGSLWRKSKHDTYMNQKLTMKPVPLYH